MYYETNEQRDAIAIRKSMDAQNKRDLEKEQEDSCISRRSDWLKEQEQRLNKELFGSK